jgi:hypothetical protein
MATDYDTRGQSPGGAGSSEYVDPGNRWISFAMTIIMLIGTLNVIEGVLAVSSSNFYARHPHFPAGSLHAWGWALILLGVAQFVAGYVLYSGSQWARWVVAASCAVNGLAQLMFVQAYPFWSLTIFAIDVLVIYAVCRYGSRAAAAYR